MRGRHGKAAAGRAAARAEEARAKEEAANAERARRLREAQAREAEAVGRLVERLALIEAMQPKVQAVAEHDEELAVEKAAAKRELAVLRGLRKALMDDIAGEKRASNEGLVERGVMEIVQELTDRYGAVNGTQRDDMRAQLRGERLRRQFETTEKSLAEQPAEAEA